ncbi:protein translocase subunit SecF [Dietzia psychralcaliphila]|uniref:Protein-export membrane protein SecF n=1 Tax=Dietzia psychralcaliphila TaxID=139021 RepID=A0AAD0JPV1_9ACTN|nr:protein translocase subunit SecF [Dietzia psychralcaliphila]AWH95585.1 preprotein translocase subunit SecF [Dietzia psychralcaliphila]PTM88665.1 protein translocase subunit secF [Dietzia psychralcaliphila]
MTTATTTAGGEPSPAAKPDGLFNRLYTGTGAFGIIPNRRRFYVLTTVIVAVCLASILFRGFTFGIDFTGGTKLTMPAGDVDKDRVAAVVQESVGEEPQTVQIVGAGAARIVEVETRFLTSDEIMATKFALFEEFQPVTADGETSVEAIGDSARSESWGGQVTERALIALAVFLVVVFGYIAFRFEWQMATAAIVALLFDVITTAGVYSLVGFEVTPATVIGLLTILGFSLYDTVIVFDKVEENTRGLKHTASRTFAEEANLAVNQTLMRSIHTTVIGILPLLALVVIAVWILGVGTLMDLALVQMVGIITGTFSSVFLATPLLVSMKERNPEIRRQTAKVLARREKAEATA